jgi:hypothetical protein
VCEAWVGVLIELLPSLGRDAGAREVLQLALSKGQVDESVASRVLCCRLLGAVTPRLVRWGRLVRFENALARPEWPIHSSAAPVDSGAGLVVAWRSDKAAGTHTDAWAAAAALACSALLP